MGERESGQVVATGLLRVLGKSFFMLIFGFFCAMGHSGSPLSTPDPSLSALTSCGSHGRGGEGKGRVHFGSAQSCAVARSGEAQAHCLGRDPSGLQERGWYLAQG